MRPAFRTAPLALLLALAAPADEREAPAAPRAVTGVRYARIEGVDPDLLSLDLYRPPGDGPWPVLVMIHGGGWRGGDKAHAAVGADKARAFTRRGYLYASINYRLSPAVRHPAHVQDVARALAWLHAHVVDHGGDPDRLFVMGHSAGAHLAALVATDARRLAAEGLPLSVLDGVILLDGAGYDIPRTMEAARPMLARLYRAAFGGDPAGWRDASPVTHVAPGRDIPPFLVLHAGAREASAARARELVASLTAAGVAAWAVHAPDKDHGSINRDIGNPDDPVTTAIELFLLECGARPGEPEPPR